MPNIVIHTTGYINVDCCELKPKEFKKCIRICVILTGSFETYQIIVLQNTSEGDASMNKEETEKEAINKKFEDIHSNVRRAPGPKGEDVPEWLEDGVADLYSFFNSTAELWDQKFGTEQSDPLYQAVSQQIAATDADVSILDLGCGTGLELEAVFARAPNAKITGIDLAPNMLNQLRSKFSSRMGQITLIQGHYLDIPLEEAIYDYAIATLTLHHLPPDNKVRIYEKIRTALKENGLYIEGDQSCAPEEEDFHWYNEYISKLPGGDRAQWNFDITLSVETNMRLLYKAGFLAVSLAWEKRDNRGNGLAVIVSKQ